MRESLRRLWLAALAVVMFGALFLLGGCSRDTLPSYWITPEAPHPPAPPAAARPLPPAPPA
jgi:hypothetical protein